MVFFGKTNTFWSEANHSRNELTQIIQGGGRVKKEYDSLYQ